MDTSDGKLRGEVANWTFAILLIFFAASLGLNVWFARFGHVGKLGLTQSRLSKPGEGTVGGKPKFSKLLDADGRPTVLDTGTQKLFYVFSPTCYWCKRNFASMKSLSAQVGSRIEVIGLAQSSEGLREYLSGHDLPFKVVVDNDPYDVATLDLTGTPQTILVVDGQVKHNWVGAYQGTVKKSIQDLMAVSLPELSPDSTDHK